MLATSAYMVAFRIVHIVAATIWVGSLFVVVVFIQPSAAAIGPAGAPFMSELRRRRLIDVILVVALITVSAGAFLYWHDWHTYPDFIGSRFGDTLATGAVLAISVIGLATIVTRPTIGRLVALGRQIAERGGPPSPETAAEVGRLQRRLMLAERTSLVLTVLAAVAMASARYL